MSSTCASSSSNVLATLDRRLEADQGRPSSSQARGSGRSQTGIRARRLVDHFYPVEATLDDLVAGRDIDCGDFAVGTFQAKVQRESSRVALIMDRVGRAGDCSIRVRKTIALVAGESILARPLRNRTDSA